MNKRAFKKGIESISDSACISMAEIFYTNKNVDQDKVNEAIDKILKASVEAKNNANITFDKGVKAFGSLKEYYKAKKEFFCKLFDKITDDFNNELEEALKLFNSTVPDEVKAENKAAAK